MEERIVFIKNKRVPDSKLRFTSSTINNIPVFNFVITKKGDITIYNEIKYKRLPYYLFRTMLVLLNSSFKAPNGTIIELDMDSQGWIAKSSLVAFRKDLGRRVSVLLAEKYFQLTSPLVKVLDIEKGKIRIKPFGHGNFEPDYLLLREFMYQGYLYDLVNSDWFKRTHGKYAYGFIQDWFIPLCPIFNSSSHLDPTEVFETIFKQDEEEVKKIEKFDR